MPTNQFRKFATGPGANIEAQSDFDVDDILTTGFQSGLAPSAKFNKVWRQSAFVSHCISQFIMNQLNLDVNDDNDEATYITKFQNALAHYITTGVLFQSFLSGNADFYVGGTGANDLNDGSIASPWATLDRARAVLKTINNNGYTITVHCQGNFSGGLNINGAFPGGGFVQFIFASGSSITVPTGPCISATSNAAISIVGPVTLSATMPSPATGGDGDAIFSATSGTITVNGVQYGACTGSHIEAISGGVIQNIGNYAIVGNATQNHMTCSDGGVISMNVGSSVATITLIGTPSFGSAFVVVTSLGDVFAPSTRIGFSGSAVGIKYFVGSNGILNTVAGGPNFFPGSIAGSTATGGQYL
jgi:hypothetical protein